MVRLNEALPLSRNQEFNSPSLAALDGDAANGMERNVIDVSVRLYIDK
jgi:hypothetical protein